jgi:AraC-like DNA-binding protein
MIFVSGITLSFFLSLLLFTKRQKDYSDRLLAAWFFFAALHQLLFYLDYQGLNDQYPFLAGVVIPFPFVHGPFLFLYVSARVGQVTPRQKKLNLLHFLPFVSCIVYMIPFFLLPASQRLYIMKHQGVGYEIFSLVKFIAIIISGLSYVALSLRLLYRYQRDIVNRYSNLTKVDLQWLMYLVVGLALIWMVVIFFSDLYTLMASVVFMSVAGFFGLRHAGVLSGKEQGVAAAVAEWKEEQSPPSVPEADGKKVSRYEKSGLTDEKKAKMAAELDEVMKEKKPYLNPDLTLDLLAAELSLNPNHLSQLINEELKVTFYDYVNTLRVREFERLAASPDSRKFTLLALAYHSGFNSKSTFNRYFKKVTGKSPSEYLRDLPESASGR